MRNHWLRIKCVIHCFAAAYDASSSADRQFLNEDSSRRNVQVKFVGYQARPLWPNPGKSTKQLGTYVQAHVYVPPIEINTASRKQQIYILCILPSEHRLIKDGLRLNMTIWGARATDTVINITMFCSWHSSKIQNLSGRCILICGM
jgi:hypothetical protein